MRLLAAADLHIGRRPPDLPADEAAQVSSAAAWLRLCDEAIRLGVDAVVLAGDVIDVANQFYEAAAALDAGLARLRPHGIWTFAVAGNHDALLLPEIAAMNDRRPEPERQLLRLLGLRGEWERVKFARGAETLHLVGWSFPTKEFRANPLASFPPALRGLRPALGLLHGDRDGAASPYAPFPSAALEQTGIRHWLLGHIHKPDTLEGARAFYPGSLQGLDAGECGVHGPALIEVDTTGAIRLQRAAAMPLRYEEQTFDLGEVPDREAMRTSVNRALLEWTAALEQRDALKHVVVRPLFRCTSTQRAKELLSLVQELWDGAALPCASGARLRMHGPALEVRPPVDLGALAAQHDVRGALARLILELDGQRAPSAEVDGLRAALAGEVNRLELDAAEFRDFDSEHERAVAEPPDRLLRRQAWALLGQLIEQKRDETKEARR